LQSEREEETGDLPAEPAVAYLGSDQASVAAAEDPLRRTVKDAS
jgi:hypothetical protein